VNKTKIKKKKKTGILSGDHRLRRYHRKRSHPTGRRRVHGTGEAQQVLPQKQNKTKKMQI